MKRLLLSSVVVLGLACGGGGGGGTTSTPPPDPPGPSAYEGPWKGTLTSDAGGTVTATAMITASGEIEYAASNLVAARGSITGYPDVSAAGTLYPRTGGTLPNGASTGRFTLTGTGTAWNTLSGTYSGAGDTGTFSFTYDGQADYTRPVVMANVAGAYTSTATSTGTTVQGSLNADGIFTGTDSAGGSCTGYLVPLDPSENCFQATIHYWLGGQLYSYQGLGYFAFSGSTVLNLVAFGTTGQFSGTFTKN